jgi:hypothetical protein
VSAVSVVAAIDDLYRRAVEHPGSVDDESLAAWMSELAAALDPPVDKVYVREAGKAARRVRRLARYWAERDPESLPDWRNGVDEALGGSGWMPTLAVARHGLDVEPSEHLFELVKERHRAVHFQPWMEGVSFAEWRAAG